MPDIPPVFTVQRQYLPMEVSEIKASTSPPTFMNKFYNKLNDQ